MYWSQLLCNTCTTLTYTCCWLIIMYWSQLLYSIWKVFEIVLSCCRCANMSIVVMMHVYICCYILFYLMIVLKFLNQLTAKECPLLSDPQNGLVDAPSNTVRSIARYSCQTGYNLVGMNERECLTSAKWSGSPPSCISKIRFSSVINLSIYLLFIYPSIYSLFHYCF